MTQLSSNTQIAIIGGGKMGEAILGGWIASTCAPVDVLSAANFIVANPGAERRAYLEKTYGVTCVEDAREITQADIVVLAVKPQVMMDVLATIKDKPVFEQSLYISIAAGLPANRLAAALPAAAHLVRVMPNTPLMVAAGTTAVCTSATCTEEDVALVRSLFACLGSAHVVTEDQMDAVCALSGSGPAYVAAMVEAMRDAGVAQGLDYELAEALALDTVYGTSKLMKDKDQTPEFTRVSVCSPGGTTLAALDAMNAAGFNNVFTQGINAAVVRSKELASC